MHFHLLDDFSSVTVAFGEKEARIFGFEPFIFLENNSCHWHNRLKISRDPLHFDSRWQARSPIPLKYQSKTVFQRQSSSATTLHLLPSQKVQKKHGRVYGKISLKNKLSKNNPLF